MLAGSLCPLRCCGRKLKFGLVDVIILIWVVSSQSTEYGTAGDKCRKKGDRDEGGLFGWVSGDLGDLVFFFLEGGSLFKATTDQTKSALFLFFHGHCGSRVSNRFHGPRSGSMFVCGRGIKRLSSVYTLEGNVGCIVQGRLMRQNPNVLWST